MTTLKEFVEAADKNRVILIHRDDIRYCQPIVSVCKEHKLDIIFYCGHILPRFQVHTIPKENIQCGEIRLTGIISIRLKPDSIEN